MQYEYLEHTADLKIRAYGKSLEEVFSNMGLAMFEAIKDEKLVEKDEAAIQDFEINSIDLPSLIVDYLSQLILFSDESNEIYNNFELGIMQVGNENWSLKGRATGYKVKGFKMEIKAVTYNELIINEREGNWVAEVVFDI
ncbi:archease [Candidatus Falkowbacteria bacterium]|nr:archease [Candidatus Falkowbacteria bacterium]